MMKVVAMGGGDLASKAGAKTVCDLRGARCDREGKQTRRKDVRCAGRSWTCQVAIGWYGQRTKSLSEWLMAWHSNDVQGGLVALGNSTSRQDEDRESEESGWGETEDGI